MKLKVSKSFVGGLILLAIGLFMRTQIPQDVPLGWFIPSLYSWLLIVLSAGLILTGLIGWKKNEKDQMVWDFSKFKTSSEWQSIAMIGMVFVYYICISFFGMVVSTVAFVVAAYLFLGVKSWKTILIGTIVCVAVYLLFDLGLRIRFPDGLLI